MGAEHGGMRPVSISRLVFRDLEEQPVMQHGPIVDDGIHGDRRDLLGVRRLEDEVLVELAGAGGPRTELRLERRGVARGLPVVRAELEALDRRSTARAAGAAANAAGAAANATGAAANAAGAAAGAASAVATGAAAPEPPAP